MKIKTKGLAGRPAAHDIGDGGAHHEFGVFDQPLRFRLFDFPKPRPTPDFELPDLGGETVHLRDLRGKVVLLNFWATWCPPCVKEMPSLERLHRRFRDDPLEVVAISMDTEAVSVVRDFVKKGGYTFRVLQDADQTTKDPFGVPCWGLPLSYVIDHRGRMIAGAIGAQNWSSKDALAYFERLIRRARLARPSPTKSLH